MPYVPEASLTTDSREVSVSTTWDSQADWEAYQSATNVDITNGVVSLEFFERPPSGVARYEYEDEATTTTAVDSWGTYDLSLSGPAYTSTAQQGSNALAFDGVDDEAENTSFADVGNNFTAMTWVQPQADPLSEFAVLVVNGNQGGGSEFKFLLQDDGSGNFRVQIGNGSTSAMAGSLSYTETWYHLAATYDGSVLRFYVDGTETDVTSVSMTTYTTDELYAGFGLSDTGERINNANVILDDTRVYDSALSASEISSVYNNTA